MRKGSAKDDYNQSKACEYPHFHSNCFRGLQMKKDCKPLLYKLQDLLSQAHLITELSRDKHPSLFCMKQGATSITEQMFLDCRTSHLYVSPVPGLDQGYKVTSFDVKGEETSTGEK